MFRSQKRTFLPNLYQPFRLPTKSLHTKSLQEALVGLLLESGANVDSRNSDGATPLYGAAQNGHVGVVRLLLFHRADVNAQVITGDEVLLAFFSFFFQIVAECSSLS